MPDPIDHQRIAHPDGGSRFDSFADAVNLDALREMQRHGQTLSGEQEQILAGLLAKLGPEAPASDSAPAGVTQQDYPATQRR
jgi:hypothetical protein